MEHRNICNINSKPPSSFPESVRFPLLNLGFVSTKGWATHATLHLLLPHSIESVCQTGLKSASICQEGDMDLVAAKKQDGAFSFISF